MQKRSRWLIILAATVAISVSFACRSSRDSGGGFEIIAPADETDAAGRLVAEANVELKKIRVLYDANEGKRQEIKDAMGSNKPEQVKKVSDEIVQIINEGFDSGKAAVQKIQEAQQMKINDDFSTYLNLKEQALTKQMAAFEEYRQAARTLRNNYDPKNAASKEKVTEDFDNRSERYRKLMEEARDVSNQANELYKDTLKKQQQ